MTIYRVHTISKHTFSPILIADTVLSLPFEKESSIDTIFGENIDIVRVNLYVTLKPFPFILFNNSKDLLDTVGVN